MRKSLFLYKVKPPTSKTFDFFQSKGIVTIFIVRYAFASPSLFLRFKSVVSPFHRMGKKWDLQGICKGIT